MAAVTEVKGKRFVQLEFATASSDTYEMDQEYSIRSIRLTAPPGVIADSDYIIFKEVYGSNPQVFTLSNEEKVTFFVEPRYMKLGIDSYSLTNPTDVVLSIEIN